MDVYVTGSRYLHGTRCTRTEPLLPFHVDSVAEVWEKADEYAKVLINNVNVDFRHGDDYEVTFYLEDEFAYGNEFCSRWLSEYKLYKRLSLRDIIASLFGGEPQCQKATINN